MYVLPCVCTRCTWSSGMHEGEEGWGEVFVCYCGSEPVLTRADGPRMLRVDSIDAVMVGTRVMGPGCW